MKILLSLKEEFTKTIGQKWTPELIKQCTTTTSSKDSSNSASTMPIRGASNPGNKETQLSKEIELQGSKVRELKFSKAKKVLLVLLTVLLLIFHDSNIISFLSFQ